MEYEGEYDPPVVLNVAERDTLLVEWRKRNGGVFAVSST